MQDDDVNSDVNDDVGRMQDSPTKIGRKFDGQSWFVVGRMSNEPRS